MLTGLYPSRHGARTDAHAIAKGVPTLAMLLAERGFETGAIVGGGCFC